MTDFNTFLQERLSDKQFALEYYRQATYFRLADQLLLLRIQRGLTQKELAEKAGTTQTVVSRLENVSVHPSLETVVKLAESLDAVVEVRLVPLEELQSAQQPAPVQVPRREVLTFKTLQELVPGEGRVEEQKKPVRLDMHLSWSLIPRPPLQPVLEEQKIPEYA